MVISSTRIGRPKVDSPKSQADRTRDSRMRSKALGRVERKFILDADSADLFDTLRRYAGFSTKEKSEFFAALLLRVANKNWLGKPFTLPIEEAL
ncbi:Ribbon-helix-helix CopG family protein [Vibrio crassostreae]|nr:Ribbon-helix-helix CopG family protein [Vibrio crassostreae]